ncbi:UNVERIFIED_CONTAM: cytochrome C oxidase Cbb3, partial [Bacteroidetes bacterium 56_B9]
MLIWSCLPAAAQQEAAAGNGAVLYAQHCAQCHDATDPQARVPNRGALRSMAFEQVLGALTTGSMAS